MFEIKIKHHGDALELAKILVCAGYKVHMTDEKKDTYYLGHTGYIVHIEEVENA